MSRTDVETRVVDRPARLEDYGQIVEMQSTCFPRMTPWSRDQIHITPNERRWWGVQPGSDVLVFDTDRGTIAILICDDVEFPDLARIVCDMGAEILFVPFNTDERTGYLHVRTCAQARAIETQCFVAISGVTGLLPQVENVDMHDAQCGVFTPSDFHFARDMIPDEAVPNTETLVIADVDPHTIRRNRVMGTAGPYADRRHDLYSIRYLGVIQEKPR